jgi:hypothetical protein
MAGERVPGYLGRVLDNDGTPVGTCFQVAHRIAVTAWHVLDAVDAGRVEAAVRVDGLALGSPRSVARVVRADPVHDLAVLLMADPFSASVAGFVASDAVEPNSVVQVLGVSCVDGEAFRYTPATGYWVGSAMRDDEVSLGVMASQFIAPGMSGGPVRRLSDDTVVGVVSGRYNSGSNWFRDTVWLARVESLLPLLEGLTPVVEAREPDVATLDPLAEELTRLGKGSIGSDRRRRSVNTVPSVPARFVRRDRMLDEVRHRLLLPGSESGSVVGLVGMGGCGKSTLARAVAADDRVRERFNGGIVWVPVGPTADLASCQSQVAATCGDSRPITDLATGRERLRQLLDGPAMLLILDNVWHVDHVRAFDLDLPELRVLVTTRTRDALFHDSVPCEVGLVDDAEAREILARYSGFPLSELPGEADAVIAGCGGLALALSIAGGMVAEGRQWPAVVERFRRSDLSRLAAHFRDYPYPNLLSALDISVTALPDEHRERFLELVAFDGMSAVPLGAVARLWRLSGMDDLDCDELMFQLMLRSLVRHDPETDTWSVHDLLIDYIKATVDPTWIRQAHARLVAACLRSWGGLATRLAGLVGVEPSDVTELHLLQHMVRHIISSNEPDLVHRLLELEVLDTEQRRTNVWYGTFERLGLLEAYLNNVRLAWRLAERTTDDAISRGEPAPEVALEIRYALSVGSIVSIAASIPVPLLIALVKRGHWLPPQAVAYAQAIPDPRDRTRALIGLSKFLDETQRAAVIAQALELSRAVGSPYLRSQTLANLAAYLPDPDQAAILNQVADLNSSINDPYVQVQTLVSMAARTAGPRRTVMIKRALRTAGTIRNDLSKARALAMVTLLLPESKRDGMLAKSPLARLDLEPGLGAPAARSPSFGSDLAPVLALARQIADHDDDATDLLTLALQIADPRQTLLTEAVDLSRGISQPDWRARALLALTDEVDESERGVVLAQALEVACGIGEPYRLARALTWLAPQLAEPRRSAALAQALSALSGSLEPFLQVKGLANLMPHLAGPTRADVAAQAWGIASGIPDPYRLARSLIWLVPFLPEAERSAALDEALSALRGPIEPFLRVKGLANLIPHLAGAIRAEALAEAWEIACGIPDPYRLAQSLTWLAPLLAEPRRGEAMEKALASAHAINGPYWQSKAMTRLARQLPEPRRSHTYLSSLRAAQRITDPYRQVQALSNLSGRVPQRLLGEALHVARTMNSPYWQLESISALIPHLPLAARVPVIDAALSTAAAIDGPYWQTRAYIGLIPHLPPRQARDILAHCLDTIPKITDAYRRAHALAGTAVHLMPDLLPRIFDIVRTIADPLGMSHALISLMSVLPPDFTTTAVTIARQLTDPAQRARVLTELATHLAPEDQVTVCIEALATTLAVTNAVVREDLLATLAPLLPAEQTDQLRTLAGDVVDHRRRVRILTATLSTADHGLRTEVLAAINEAIERITQPEDRVDALLHVAAHLDEADRRRAYVQALLTATNITDAYRHVAALIMIGVRVQPPNTDTIFAHALDIARTIVDPYQQVQAILELAPHLHEEDLRHVLTSLSTIGTTYGQALLITGLAAYLSPPTLELAATAARSLTNPAGKVYATAAIVAAHGQNTHPRWDTYWRDALAAAASSSRQAVLALIPTANAALQNITNDDVFLNVVRAIQETQAWWP